MTAVTALILFLFILFLAHFTTALVEAVLGKPLDLFKQPAFQPWKPMILQYAAMGVGVGLGFHYRLDLISVVWTLLQNATQLTLPIIQESWVGYLLTGLGIGQGAIWLHELVKKIIPNIPNQANK